MECVRVHGNLNVSCVLKVWTQKLRPEKLQQHSRVNKALESTPFNNYLFCTVSDLDVPSLQGWYQNIRTPNGTREPREQQQFITINILLSLHSRCTQACQNRTRNNIFFFPHTKLNCVYSAKQKWQENMLEMFIAKMCDYLKDSCILQACYSWWVQITIVK